MAKKEKGFRWYYKKNKDGKWDSRCVAIDSKDEESLKKGGWQDAPVDKKSDSKK